MPTSINTPANTTSTISLHRNHGGRPILHPANPMNQTPDKPSEKSASQPDPTGDPGAPHDAGLPTFRSEDILQGHREVVIVHQGDQYRLRLTRTGKLILNK